MKSVECPVKPSNPKNSFSQLNSYLTEIWPVSKLKADPNHPFLEEGTSIIAAEKTRRRFYGIEIDPRYVDATISRWQKFTGQKVHHANTRKIFQEQGGDDE